MEGCFLVKEIEKFREYLREEEKSKNTIKNISTMSGHLLHSKQVQSQRKSSLHIRIV